MRDKKQVKAGLLSVAFFSVGLVFAFGEASTEQEAAFIVAAMGAGSTVALVLTAWGWRGQRRPLSAEVHPNKGPRGWRTGLGAGILSCAFAGGALARSGGPFVGMLMGAVFAFFVTAGVGLALSGLVHRTPTPDPSE